MQNVPLEHTEEQGLYFLSCCDFHVAQVSSGKCRQLFAVGIRASTERWTLSHGHSEDWAATLTSPHRALQVPTSHTSS